MLIIYVALYLAIPIIIIIAWKKRPVLSVIIASLILFLEIFLPTIFTTIQALMIYGTADPQLLANEISQVIASTMMGLLTVIIFVPMLAGLSWLVRRKSRL